MNASDQKMIFVRAGLVATLLCLSAAVCARDIVEATKDAQVETASELATCAAYYVLAAAMIDASDVPGPERDKSIAQMKQTSEVALNSAAQISSAKVAAARMDLARQTMQREMENEWSNFSVIAVKYMWSCKDIVERPDLRFAYWVKEKQKLPDVAPPKAK